MSRKTNKLTDCQKTILLFQYGLEENEIVRILDTYHSNLDVKFMKLYQLGLSPREIALVLDFHVSTINKWIKNKGLPRTMAVNNLKKSTLSS